MSLGSISYALIFREIVDAAMAGSRSNRNRWILLFIALVIFQVSMGACNRFLREDTQALLQNCFKNRLFSFLFKCDYEKISGRHSREWMNRLTSKWRSLFAYVPQGLDTFLGERGAGLSEGQMQRIAIARAIYANRPILVLDESTSALDEETEKKVLSNLREITEKTVLIITHRKAALEICDRELRFSEGSIREIP